MDYFRTIRVKGQQRPVDIYELRGEAGEEETSESSKGGTMNTLSGEVDLTIPMLPEMELAASKTATAVAEFMKLKEDQVEEVRLALIEACLNAIEHSNSRDRKIYVNFIMREDQLEITIQDFGEGFDVDEIRRKIVEREPGKLIKRGWGLSIMEGLMDSVEVKSSSGGTLIRMIKRTA